MYTKPLPAETASGSRSTAPLTPPNGAKASPNLSHEFKDLIADIEDLVMQTASLSGDELTLARAKLSERLESAKSSLQDMGNNLARRARRTATATNEYVHEQPWKAIGIGATVGLLLGVILARR